MSAVNAIKPFESNGQNSDFSNAIFSTSAAGYWKFDDFIKQLCAYWYKRRNVFDQSDRAQIVMGVPKREGPPWINQKSVKRCH